MLLCYIFYVIGAENMKKIWVYDLYETNIDRQKLCHWKGWIYYYFAHVSGCGVLRSS